MARSASERVADYEARIKKLEAQKRAVMAREAKANRKRRDHALIVAGGLVVSCFDDGWESIDWERLAKFVRKNKSVFEKCATDVLPSNEAAKRLRAWEKSTRAREGADDDVKKVKGQGAGQGV